MSLFVLDTDILSLYQRGHAVVVARVDAHPRPEVVTTIITVLEQIIGWQALLARATNRQQQAAAYDFFVGIATALNRFPLLNFPEPAILRFEQLLSLRLNVGKMDLRIAAIALEFAATVVTRNRRDFGRVPNLQIEDWSV